MGKTRKRIQRSYSSSSSSSSDSSKSRSRERYRKTACEKQHSPQRNENQKKSKSPLYEGRRREVHEKSQPKTRRELGISPSRIRRPVPSEVHLPNCIREAPMSDLQDESVSRATTSNSVAGCSTQSQESCENRIERLEKIIENMSKQQSMTPEKRRYTIYSDCIPEFHPENEHLSAIKWLDKIEQLKVINDWDETTTIYNMQSRLSGMARTWYHNLNSVNYTWTEWKELIIKTFPDHIDYAKILRKMLNRTKLSTETMTCYYFCKMELLTACQITGKHAVSCVIDGIPDVSIQNAARAGRYATPEALFEEYLGMLRDEGTDQSVNQMDLRNTRLVRSDIRVKHSKPYSRPDDQHLKNIRCFNCKMKGHVQSKCTKPKLVCSKCNLLGHDARQCRVRPMGTNFINKGKPEPVLTLSNDQCSNSCYFIDCVINGTPLRGYVDSGCAAVTIRDSDAKNLNLKREPTLIRLCGYAGGSVVIKSKTQIHLKVDLASVHVEALIVPDRLQNVPVIVGQPFLNNENVTVVLRGNQIRLYHQNDATSNQIDKLILQKVNLRAKETTVIPPNFMGHIFVENDQNNNEVFIDFHCRNWSNNLHIILPCVIKTNNLSCFPILNLSDQHVCYEKGRVIVRAYTCFENCDGDAISQSCLKTNISALKPFTLEDIENKVNPNLNHHQRVTLLTLLNEYRDCFATCLRELGKTDVAKMSITLNDNEPVTYRPYRMPYANREKVREIVKELMNNDIIRESESAYASPILLVRKKNGEERMCIDYRSINRKCLKMNQPLPRIDDLLDNLEGNSFYTTLDLASGYHQIPVDEESVQKTAFVTPDGHYEFLRMPFGLVNAPAIFQRTINKILGPLRFDSAMAYLDDILIPSVTIAQGIEKLRMVLEAFRVAGMTFKLNKCRFLQTQIEYLGHEITGQGIKPGRDKIRAVSEFPTPKDVHEVRRFLGLASYFRKFIQGFAAIAKPLSELTRKNSVFAWNPEQEGAFSDLKRKLTERPVLAIYNKDAKTEVHCDASKIGLGGILMQEQSDKSLKPVQYFSRATTKEEQNYHSYELETLAVVSTLKKFRVYLIGSKFKIITDCNSLRHTLLKRDLVPRIARWWLSIQDFDFDIEYRPGTKMSHVDALSRGPAPEKSDNVLDMLIVNIEEEDWILAAQRQDDECKRLIDTLSKEPNDTDERRIHKEYCLKNSRLFRKTDKGDRWVIPKSARKRILMYYHDNSGHFAADKTCELIKSRYWFSSMKRYVKNYINSCLGCLYNKNIPGKTPGSLNPIEKRDIPMDTLHIDHLGPFVKSVKKNTYLILAVDGFTKFVFLAAVASTKTIPVINFLNKIFDTFGVPRRIICDRGTAFTSKQFTEYCSKLGIKRVLCATSTPRANGQVERMNRTVLSAVMATTEDESRWDEALSRVRWGINSTVNSTTGKSPYELFFGYRPRGLDDAFLTAEVCEDKRADLASLRNDVSQKILCKQRYQKEYYDKTHAPPMKFGVGQYVLVRKPKGSNDGKSRKLEPRFKGPFLVTQVLDNDRYVVEELPGSRRSRKAYIGIYPSERMKLFTACPLTDENSWESE